jgi:hypothetical protein
VNASSVPGSVHAASVPAASVPGTGVHAASVHTTYTCFHEPTCCVQPVPHVCSASIQVIFKRFTGCVQKVPILDVFARYLHICIGFFAGRFAGMCSASVQGMFSMFSMFKQCIQRMFSASSAFLTDLFSLYL